MSKGNVFPVLSFVKIVKKKLHTHNRERRALPKLSKVSKTSSELPVLRLTQLSLQVVSLSFKLIFRAALSRRTILLKLLHGSLQSPMGGS
jgi:hypothetical protein